MIILQLASIYLSEELYCMKYKNLKRGIDVVAGLCALPIIVILIPPVAMAIKIEDRGSIFYTGNRRGKNGKIFKMYKFRSMIAGAPDIRNSDNSTFNSDKDVRLTKVGRLIRKTSIDELPQILNVLKGDMSIVGPRPHMATRSYSELNDQEKKALEVRPGITGYAQALHRNSISAKEKSGLDCYYVDNLSFKLDLEIISRTFLLLLSRKGIYNSKNSK